MPASVPRPKGSIVAVSEPRSLVIGGIYEVERDGQSRRASVLEVRTNKKGVTEAYVAFENSDKRLDTWIPVSDVGHAVEQVDTGMEGSKRRKLNNDANGASHDTPGSSRTREASGSLPSTPEREHAAMTRVRNFEDVRFGMYLVKTWYYSPYPLPLEEKEATSTAATPTGGQKKRKSDVSSGSGTPKIPSSRSVGELLIGGVGKNAEGSRGRLFVCDLCFKYMKTRDGWKRHVASCEQYTPPGRKVYERGSYRIWEVDGAQAPLYCQNLSLFGKLFIDHKSVFFHVENFLFYIVCDASTSRHDHTMAFFSKEKLSYDDYNLACIVTFPPCQNRGFGKLLIEFSYLLTKHPSSRSATGSPGTPERPLSDLGLKGYTAYWVSTLLRVCKELLEEAPSIFATPKKPVNGPIARTLREKKPANVETSTVTANDVDMTQVHDPVHKGQYAISTTLAELARAAHLRIDDVTYTLGELGFLKHRRAFVPYKTPKRARRQREGDDNGEQEAVDMDEEDYGEWADVEIVISRDIVDEMWAKWRVQERGVLDESCVLLDTM